jgi:hypothetical protein
MQKLNVRLTPRDEENISLLKEKYGILQTSELVGPLISLTAEQTQKEKNSSPLLTV